MEPPRFNFHHLRHHGYTLIHGAVTRPVRPDAASLTEGCNWYRFRGAFTRLSTFASLQATCFLRAWQASSCGPEPSKCLAMGVAADVLRPRLICHSTLVVSSQIVRDLCPAATARRRHGRSQSPRVACHRLPPTPARQCQGTWAAAPLFLAVIFRLKPVLLAVIFCRKSRNST